MCDDGCLLLLPDDDIRREVIQKHIGSVEIRLNDGRRISAEQRCFCQAKNGPVVAIEKRSTLWSKISYYGLMRRAVERPSAITA